jgi:P27 family predicted phage terminase small subunit
VWYRLAPDLSRREVLTTWDADVFALYCDLVDQAWRARKLLDPGLLVKGRGESVVTTPAWRVYRDAIAEIRALAQEFGLTPSARSLIRVRGLPDAPTPPSTPKTDP